MTVRILGVDPGSRVCGYAVVDGRTYVECGVIKLVAKAPLEARLAELHRDLTSIIEEFAPNEVAVEDLFYGANVRSAFSLAHARGVVFAAAGAAGLRVCSYPPSVVKQAVTGSGRAPKEQVTRMVQVLTNLATPPVSDAADALAVALTHANLREAP